MAGIIYALTNKSFSKQIKIGNVHAGQQGDTIALKNRIRFLNTGVPTPFNLVAAVRVKDEARAEKSMHGTFDEVRVPSGREFFKVGIEPVKAAMGLICLGGGGKMISTAGFQIAKEGRPKKSKTPEKIPIFKLGRTKIRRGAKLAFFFDESITARVGEGDKVVFRGKSMSLTGAAWILLRQRGWKRKASGPNYWVYRGETLTARWRRMHEKGKP